MNGAQLHTLLKMALGVSDDPPLEGMVAGHGAAEVTGIATCYSPSIEVIEGASAKDAT
jgi:hypothetical protein